MKSEQIMLFPKNLTTTIGMRLTPEEKKKLEEIAKFYNLNTSQVIRRFINAEYDNIQGHPELKEAMDKMQALTDFINSFTH